MYRGANSVVGGPAPGVRHWGWQLYEATSHSGPCPWGSLTILGLALSLQAAGRDMDTQVLHLQLRRPKLESVLWAGDQSWAGAQGPAPEELPGWGGGCWAGGS